MIQNRGDVSLFFELYIIIYRAFLCQIRNPMDVFFKIIQSVFTAVIVLLVFGEVSHFLFRSDQSIWSTTKISFKILEELFSSLLLPMHLEAYKEP